METPTSDEPEIDTSDASSTTTIADAPHIPELADDLDEEYEEEELEAEDYNPSEILEQLRVHAPGEYWVPLDWIEAAYFDHVLKMNEGEKDATADDLGMARSTVYRKMKRHSLPLVRTPTKSTRMNDFYDAEQSPER